MAATSAKPRVDYGLRLYHEVFKLDALHWGLWSDADPRDLAGVRLAQQRYTEQLLGMIPDGVTRVLDSGCGTGATAEQLRARGHEVTCITPDAYQIEVFRQRRGDAIPLVQTRLEDFAPEQPFDLVLMSESAQYVPPAELFAAATRCTRPGGQLLIADYFRLEPREYYKTCHVLEPFLQQAEQAGWRLAAREDVTTRVLPTLEVGQQLYTDTIRPTLEIAAGFLGERAPWLRRSVQLLFRRKLEKLRWYLYDKTEQKLDAERFARELRYLFLRFERPADG